MESQKTKFSCPECGKEFRQKYNMNAHIRTSHEGSNYLCDKCTRSFTSNQNLEKHKCALSQSMTKYRCAKCPMVFSSPRELAVHVRSCHATTPSTGQPNTSGRDNASSRLPDALSTSRRKTITQTPRCRICQRQIESWTSLYRHQMEEEHRQLPGSSTQSGRGDTSVKKVLQATPWRDEGAARWEDETTGEVTEPGLRDAYNLNAPFILARDRVGEVSSIFNLPVAPNFSIGELMERARDIYQSTHYSFRLNLAFGVILRNVETGDYRYFNPYENNPFFTNPIYITGVKDLEKLCQRLESMDLISHLLTQRPDTKWKPVLITNVNFYIYRSNFPLGNPPVTLPDYIKDHQAIISLDYNDRGQPYKDHLCAFRCLALYLDPEGRCSLEKPTKALYHKWVVYCRGNQLGNLKEVTSDQYTGLPSSDLPHFEDCFRVNVSVFCLDEDKIAQPKYKTRGVFKEHMYLNLHEKHLSLITKINVYCKWYRCQICSMLFKRSNNCNRHQRNCTGQTKLRFPGGFHQTPKTVFDHLEENGLSVDASERYFPWFVVFDFESFLSPIDNGSEKLRWTQAHHPISVSICSNVEGFTSPHCIVDSDTDQLIASMLEYMKEIAEKVGELAREKWAYQLSILKAWSSDDGDKTTATCSCTISEDSDSDSDSEEGEEKVGKQTGRKKKTPKQLCQKQMYALYSKLMGYCSQVPILGFNSACYDLNIIKEKLPKHLALDTVESRAFTVKKSNAYLCQSNDTFKFLDVTQYLSPGTNYSQFLKAFGVTEKKGFFPYEYLDTPEKLNETRLPPLGEAWYSNLKQKSVLDDGLKSIEENYAELEVIWEREGMTTFRDFLVWYNNLDVGPFVQAVEAMQRFYFEDGIDLFKTTMSVPGVARQKLYRESQKKGVTFALFDKYNEDLYHTMKANVVGGPSIIFTRYHKANQTFIRDNPQKRCKRVVGYDANALYLWAIDQPMPTGPFVRRRAETGFKPERRDKYMSMFYWMDWMRDKKGWDIRHKLNWGREKRVGPFIVDGWIPSSNPGDEKVILDHNGCFMHGHQCHLTQKAREDEKTREMLTRRLERTQTRAEYIRELGYTLVEKWECDFLDDRKANPELRAFIHSCQPPFYQKHGWKMSDRAILQGVETGELFGMVVPSGHSRS